MTTAELLDSGAIADAAVSSIEDHLDRFNLTPTSAGWEVLWEAIYEAVREIEVKNIK